MTLGKTNGRTERRSATRALRAPVADPPVLLRSDNVGNGRITGVQRLMDGGSIPPSSTSCIMGSCIDSTCMVA